MADPARGPGIRFPPPLVFVAGWVVAWLLNRRLTFEVAADGPGPGQVVLGLGLIAAGVALAGWAMSTFGRARTPVVPFRPARVLVQHGPFGFSRNPMYVGLTLVYLGVTLLTNLGWALVVLPGVLVLLFVAVIRREERHLQALFPDAYADYRRRVRRWL